VALHVTAKRYLVTVDPQYLDRLSDVSRSTLEVQGDTLSAGASADFLASPLWREALALRRADDMAKWPGLRTGPLHQWRSTLDEVAQRFGIMRG
jgi:predicted HD phosphohydrolase